MPQLNIIYFPSQILWLLLSFLALYFIVKYCFVPKIENILEDRARQIKANLEEAAKLMALAKSLEEDYNNLYIAMNDQISSMRMDVVNSINKEKTQKIAHLSKEILKKEEAMLANIEEAKAKAIKEMPKYIVAHAELLIEKVTGNKVEMK